MTVRAREALLRHRPGFHEEFRRHRPVQSPHDLHRTRPRRLLELGRAEAGVGFGADVAGLRAPYEEDDAGAARCVVDVSLPGRALHARRALGFPVEELLVDGVVAVHSGGGVVRFGLLERHQ